MALSFKVYSNLSDSMQQWLTETSIKAERVLAEQIKKDTAPYVPFRNGVLNRDTKVVGNLVVYPGPYARFLYYGKVMVDPETGSTYARENQRKVVTDRNLVFTTDFHPDAQAFWFEASKAQNMEKWLDVARKAVAKFGK